MLSEIKHTRQVPGEGKRRWFRDAELDLIIWYDTASEKKITGFQLCYDKSTGERALTWHFPSKYEHNAIDSGEGPYGGPKMSPILVADGIFDTGRISKAFADRGQNLPRDIADLVSGKITSFPG